MQKGKGIKLSKDQGQRTKKKLRDQGQAKRLKNQEEKKIQYRLAEKLNV